MAMTTAQKRRKDRQDELREWLSKQKLLENVIKRIDKMGAIDISNPGIAKVELDILSAQNRDSMKMVNKYLPDLKSAEIDASLEVSRRVEDMTDEQLLAILQGNTKDDEQE